MIITLTILVEIKKNDVSSDDRNYSLPMLTRRTLKGDHDIDDSGDSTRNGASGIVIICH